jgi:hypothetical protein
VNKNIAASVHARLLNRAKALGDEFNLVLTRYAIERFLYRLSISPSNDQFCLKGAQLFMIWLDQPHRPTRDADFLGQGTADEDLLHSRLVEVVSIHVDDGLTFDPNGIVIEDIRKATAYGGFRATVPGLLGSAHCPLMLDFGFGDAIVPEPEQVAFPVLLDGDPVPKIWIYPRATVVAEKLEALVDLGMGNSRMKDYFDLVTLLREGRLDMQVLGTAIGATFERRGTALPLALPLGLSDDFARDESKQSQWKAFVRKNRLGALGLEEVVAELRPFALRVFELAREGHTG